MVGDDEPEEDEKEPEIDHDIDLKNRMGISSGGNMADDGDYSSDPNDYEGFEDNVSEVVARYEEMNRLYSRHRLYHDRESAAFGFLPPNPTR